MGSRGKQRIHRHLPVITLNTSHGTGGTKEESTATSERSLPEMQILGEVIRSHETNQTRSTRPLTVLEVPRLCPQGETDLV